MDDLGTFITKDERIYHLGLEKGEEESQRDAQDIDRRLKPVLIIAIGKME